ncbi:hypothetical protein EVAR_36897_1 [Eumeta japonica]|uniref:Uncharacterized protein n=1 Tax=Eumeta variegata TaxID=151549 RepID=A0A4C1WVD9_EUMVA|nr:hypothetical protein EVAR_36897_1 [Eumeta japonica]
MGHTLTGLTSAEETNRNVCSFTVAIQPIHDSYVSELKEYECGLRIDVCQISPVRQRPSSSCVVGVRLPGNVDNSENFKCDLHMFLPQPQMKLGFKPAGMQCSLVENAINYSISLKSKQLVGGRGRSGRGPRRGPPPPELRSYRFNFRPPPPNKSTIHRDNSARFERSSSCRLFDGTAPRAVVQSARPEGAKKTEKLISDQKGSRFKANLKRFSEAHNSLSPRPAARAGTKGISRASARQCARRAAGERDRAGAKVERLRRGGRDEAAPALSALNSVDYGTHDRLRWERIRTIFMRVTRLSIASN